MVMIKDADASMQGVAVCRCSVCGREGTHKMSDAECRTYMAYKLKGHAMGHIGDLFPDIPLWIASGAIDPVSDGTAVCPECEDA